MKPEKPITRKEMYLDVATGGSTELPSPVTREEKYLAKIAGESVDIPTPVTRYEMLLAAVAGESYTLTPATRLEIYLAKAAGQDVEIPQPVTREEMYWFDYCGGTPTPPEREYTGAVPVTFVADGTPLLDYLISGNEEHSGTPTPENPIMPEGTGERTGNLAPPLTEWVDGYVSASGAIAPPSENYKEKSSDYIPVKVGREYTFSVGNEFPGGTYYPWRAIGWYTQDKTFISRASGNAGGALSTSAPSNAVYCRLSYRTHGETTNPMLNLGSTPLPYEPYGYKIPISSANTTTPVYLGEVETTRKIRKLVLTGEESSWTELSPYYTVSADNVRPWSGCICTHCAYNGIIGGNSNTRLWIKQASFPDYQTLDGFKSYLQQQYAAGTPVTVWYVLATEETAVVNEPLMRIGDYADTLSYAQAGVSIPTANGSTTLDVETAVKPSEIYIKYRGEAVTTLSSLPAEVSSPEETPEEENPEEMEETENEC